MRKMAFKNVLISVSNKTGLAECAKHLSEQGARIVSTGGTALFLEKQNISVVKVEEQTLFPEVLDGRVKTLHPHIFLPLLARKNHSQDEKELHSRNLKAFDLVICNLYPFDKISKKEDKEQIELIDVGGPSILRASAKNFETITVICDPQDYSLLKKQGTSLEERRLLSSKVFSHLSSYDSLISKWLSSKHKFEKQKSTSDKKSSEENPLLIQGTFFKKLRYGENPQQQAEWYIQENSGLHSAELLSGKELSFNNILDLQSAVHVLREFEDPCFVGVKHNNPCSTACGKSLLSAVQKGLRSDPLSIFGGIVSLNRKVSDEEARQLSSIFLECVIAPDYSKEALNILSQKKNLRILKWEGLQKKNLEDFSIYKADGGFLTQTPDKVCMNWKDFTLDGNAPSPSIKKDLEMAWKVCAYLKSNAIALVSDEKTVGLGMGQVDRITSVDLACQRMKKYHPKIQSPVVMASDGFFPFEDSIQKAFDEGIRWVIHPGGSKKDDQVIQKAKALRVNVIRTGRRHFKH